MRSPFYPLVAASLLTCSVGTAASDFVKDIQPIFEENCIRCHGENKDKGELRLDTYALTMEGGETGDAIDLRNPDKSLILELISHAHDHDDIMPPTPDENGKKGGEPLSKDQISLLDAWIRSGAKWPEGLVLKEKVKAVGKRTSISQTPP